MYHGWSERWNGLKQRRIVAGVSYVAWLVLWIIFGAGGLLAGFLLAFWAYIRLRAFPCPRCHQPIVGVRLKSFVDRCEGCGLRIFGHEYDVAEYERNPNVFTMSRRLRRAIAGYEMGSGAVLMLLSAFAGRLPFWFLIMLEGLAAFSIAAGWWLWHDEERGYRLTRTMQLIQLVRVQSSVLVYVATAGIALDLEHLNGNILINPAFDATLTLRVNTGEPFGAAINLWAAAIFLLLLHARPAAATPEVERPVADDSITTAPTEPTVDGTLPPVVAEP